MKLIPYILCIVPSLRFVRDAYSLNWFVAFFIDKNGNLPKAFKGFQTSDNPATGDAKWKEEHPTYSNYRLAVSYMNRNPAQGFDQKLKADVTMQTKCTVRGNIDIADGPKGVAGWYLIETEEGFFHFSYVYDSGNGKCWTGGFGWRLNNIVKGYDHPTMGQYVFTPIRSQEFRGK